MSTVLGLLAVLLLILGNAWFVAAEFALVTARRGRLEAAHEGGDRRAGRALQLLGRGGEGRSLGFLSCSFCRFLRIQLRLSLLAGQPQPLRLIRQLFCGMQK